MPYIPFRFTAKRINAMIHTWFDFSTLRARKYKPSGQALLCNTPVHFTKCVFVNTITVFSYVITMHILHALNREDRAKLNKMVVPFSFHR